MAQSDNQQRISVWISIIVLLFFFQLITEFIEAVYLFGLLGSEIPPEIGMVFLFLSPLLLFCFRNRISPRWINLLLTVALLARTVEIILPTRGRMIVSGIGVAAMLMVFPAILSQPRSPELQRRFTQQIGYALPPAIFVAILSRSLHSGSDLLAYGMFKMVTWGLTLIALVLLWRKQGFQINAAEVGTPSKRRIIVFVLGITSIFISIYFAFSAPNVIARWVGVPHLSVYGVLMLAWFVAGWLWLKKGDIPVKWALIWGLSFNMVLLISLLPHQVDFPASMDVGYPLLEPQIALWQYLPLYLMLVLSPVLLYVLRIYLLGILNEKPQLNTLAGAFSLAGGYILLMVLAQVFTTVYDYIPIIGPFFRDKFWLVIFIPAVGAILPAALSLTLDEYGWFFSTALRREWLVACIAIILISLFGFMLITADPKPLNKTSEAVRVFTYNIRQGYDDAGERNFDGQIDLIRTKSPDILGLQECDTARIAGGNADVVAYFADRLDMYSYYGPSPLAGTFGVALLSRYPIENAHTFYLFSFGEQVAVIEADISIGGQTYKVYVTHLGNSGPIFQQEQLLKLMRTQENVIAMGDFNFRHYEEQYKITVAEYDDAYIHAVTKEIPADFDIEERIDHIFVSQGTTVGHVEYLNQPESDHPGLFVEIRP
jgi:endonuclease/exonuclease/phosphatase family metal-dependent hydrolase